MSYRQKLPPKGTSLFYLVAVAGCSNKGFTFNFCSTSLVVPLDRTPSQPFLPAIPNVSGIRVNSLEDRLSNQERTTAVLMDQAFRIKDGIVSYLQGNKNFQQGESAAHQLLENHIQTITSVVKKLSHDIEVSAVTSNLLNIQKLCNVQLQRGQIHITYS